MEKLNGPFKDIIPNFQKYKKSIGYKYDNINNYYRLDKILYQNKIYDIKDSKKIYQVAVEQQTNISLKKQNYMCLKELYDYMKIIGYKNLYFEIKYFKSQNNHIPIILSNEEIVLFFKIVDELSKNYSYEESIIYPVLFRLVYSCGLRINEALTLENKDFNTVENTIVVTGKGRKKRLLPLSNSMANILIDYQNLKHNKTTDFLFPLSGKKYKKVYGFFKLVREKMNKFNLRIHDLRHTFAVINFNDLYAKGNNEEYILYFIGIYMGHESFKETEDYLRYTNETYKKMISKFNKKNPTIFPKVGDLNE